MPYVDDDFTFEHTKVHAVRGGEGFPLLLLHGSGPGASTMGNWRLLLEPLAERYCIYAMDLIGFGSSGRLASPPFFDIELWSRQVRAMGSRIEGERFGIVAHSLSAVFAFKLAAIEPRIAAVLTTGAMGAPFKVNDATARCWSFPENRASLLAVAGDLIHEKSRINEAYIAVRERTLFDDPGYRHYFSTMFAGEPQRFADEAVLSDDVLAEVSCPVTMLHGREDVPFPPDVTLALARHLPQADVVLLSHCAHSIAMERSDTLLASIDALFGPFAEAA